MAGNGGIIGPTNVTSRGKNKVTSTTSTGSSTLTTQPGTRLARVLVIGGGGSGGVNQGGAGGAGGFVEVCSVSVSGNTGYPVVVGAGGASKCSTSNPNSDGAAGTSSTGFCLTAVGGGEGVSVARGAPPSPATGADGGAGGSGGGGSGT